MPSRQVNPTQGTTKPDRRPVSVRVAGHFGEWLQGRFGSDGTLALITVVCADILVEGRLRRNGSGLPGRGTGILNPEVVERFLTAIDAHGRTGIDLTSNAPVGCGLGISTAGLMALARVSGYKGDLGPACVAAEGACDPLMCDQQDQVLWASRQGRALQKLPPIPEAEVLGGLLAGYEQTNPADLQFPDISDLVPGWISACHAGDLPGLARLATLSARRTTQMRGPEHDPSPSLCEKLGALGVLRAHTGTARGFIFHPGTVPDHGQAMLQDAGFQFILQFKTG